VELDLNLFRKKFYEIESIGRTDKGLKVDLQYTRFMSRQLVFHVGVSMWMNSSTANDFNFVKGDLELIFELIF
jgi:hypothetical protein